MIYLALRNIVFETNHTNDRFVKISRLFFQVLTLARSLQVLSVEASQIFDATDDQLAATLCTSPHLRNSLREISLSAFQQKIGLTRISVKNLLSHCKSLKRIRNVAYWKISYQELCQIQMDCSEVNIETAIFLADKIIPM